LAYFGDSREKPPVSIRVLDELTTDHAIFDGQPKRNWTIILSSYPTLAQRHGPSAQSGWREKTQKLCPQEIEDKRLVLDPAWPKSLGGLFRTTILDEAHQLRNLSSLQAITVSWLNAEFNLLLTATPLFNRVEDFKGLMPLIIPSKNDRLWNQFKVEPTFNPFQVPDCDPKAVLCLTHRAIDRFIWNDPGLLGGAVGHHIEKIWQHCLLRRCLSSRIPFDNGRVIGDSIPPSQICRYQLSYYDFEQKQYDRWVKQIGKNLLCKLPDGRIVWNMAKYREMTLITSWLWFRYVHEDVKAGNTKALVAQLHEKKIAKLWIVKAMMVENEIRRKKVEYRKSRGEPLLDLEEGFFSIPNKIDDISDMEALKYLLKGSPKLRTLLPNIRDEILLYGEKSIIWTLNPGEQLFVAAALALCNIDVRVLHAELKSNERQEMIHEFVTKPKNAMVLVCSFYINSSGSNLQGLCRNVHLWDIPMSEALLMQAIGRVRRLGQKRIVKVYDYTVLNSFNIKQLENNLAKMIPGLVAELSDELFNITFNHDTKEIDLGYWVRNSDGTLSPVPHNSIDRFDSEKLVQSDELMYALLEAMKEGSQLRMRSLCDDDYPSESSSSVSDAPLDVSDVE
jgi:hypothetical protein